VRYVLSMKSPAGSRMLFIESGSRSLAEGVLPHLRETWAANLQIDLVTCYGEQPAGLAENAEIIRVNDYGTPEKRRMLIDKLRGRDYAYLGMICSGEPVMSKWKWVLALRVPAKVFIVNENGDYFWLNRENASIVREFALVRMGLEGAGALRTIGRLLVFPFAILYLLLYAFVAHARRALRLAFSRQS
jgi:hypothetical protein